MADTPLPIYEVDFIPIERRMGERRVNPGAGLPKGVAEDRRKRERRHNSAVAQQASNARNT